MTDRTTGQMTGQITRGGMTAPRSIALRTRLLVAMIGPLLGVAMLLGIAGAALIADVVRRTNDRVLGGALGAIAETVQVERGEVTLDLPPAAFACALAALALSLATRAAVTLGTGEPAATIPLHPVIVLTALAIQWNVLLRRERAGAATWKGRSYPVGGAE